MEVIFSLVREKWWGFFRGWALKGSRQKLVVCRYEEEPARGVYPGSRILIFTHPGSRISDPGSKNSNKREGWKKNFCHTFLCSHKFHKIEHYFSFEVLKKKMWANFQTFYPKNCHQALKNMGLGSGTQDPGSGKKPIPNPGSRIHGSKRHRIPDPDPQHWFIRS